MDCNLILIAAAIAIEIPVAGIAAYFILKARKTVVSVVPAPTEPAATFVPKPPYMTCIKCGHRVARYTPTPEGPICANELRIV
jgi:hypothetical protein